MAKQFNEDEIFGLIFVAGFFGFGLALISESHVGNHAAVGIGIVSAILFGFALGFFIKLVRKIVN